MRSALYGGVNSQTKFMNIQKQLDASTSDLWAKFITRVGPIGDLKKFTGNRNKLLNSYFEQFGFAGIGDEWQKITKHNAKDCIRTIASTSLFYGGERMSVDKASRIAEHFLSKFSSSAKYYTNLKASTWEPELNLEDGYSSSWDFDAYIDEDGRGYISCISVIAYDEYAIGMLCKLESD
ncbi:hypothetical protein ACMXYQ_08010 [Neptuniibacter sp. PT34_22]|uniref:hypothetical protein n=1 Tax=Neptuniibacter sp. PT34_22 TaxID=3398205 RepID=UPI0039F4A1C9